MSTGNDTATFAEAIVEGFRRKLEAYVELLTVVLANAVNKYRHILTFFSGGLSFLVELLGLLLVSLFLRCLISKKWLKEFVVTIYK